jgi:hypothetical protein
MQSFFCTFEPFLLLLRLAPRHLSGNEVTEEKIEAYGSASGVRQYVGSGAKEKPT